ncbi:AraC family transcriptional regulator [Streptomyces venezuelae]|uniref:AraC family transcriptional regulator n=1 Tax=Streptomyces venezuelae TaxID=54571 RepID=A0A5P2DE87_STRVZ|nr:DJ-1/PfpI family protein [Streptomyces venezuelae]QES51389.1 AraC family transcriptional regulator [Streptomyces venezuelae]
MAELNRRGALMSAAGAGAALVTGIPAASASSPGPSPAAPAAAPATASAAAPRERSAHDPLRVHIVLFDGVEELDVFGPLEVFAAAAVLGHPVRTLLVTSGRPGRITASFGTDVAVPGAWDPGAADVIVVPGGGFKNRQGPGVWAEIRKGVLTRELRRAARPSLTLFGVCTGAVVLHAAGLIGDRPCTTHHRAQQYLKDQGADVRTARVVDDGNLVCAGGISSGIDGALWMLEREIGSAAATGVETLMECERRGTVLRTARTARERH